MRHTVIPLRLATIGMRHDQKIILGEKVKKLKALSTVNRNVK